MRRSSLPLVFGLPLLGALAGAEDAPPPPKPARPVVAVLYLEDRTGDPAHACWRSIVNEILYEKLAAVHAIRLVRRVALNGAFGKIGHAIGEPFGLERARRIGEFLEAQRIVFGFYEREGTGWRVSVRVLRTAAGTASHEITASGDWFSLCDVLALEILRDLRLQPSPGEGERMKKRWTSSAEALHSIANVYFATQLHEPISVQEAHIKKALAADPSCSRSHWMAAALAGTQSHLLDAEASARSALRLEPSYAAAHRLLGHVLLLQRRRSEGLVELREARKLDADDPETLHSLMLAAGGEEALALMKTAAELDRTDPRVHTALAQLYLARSERERAFEAMLDAERLNLGLINEEQQLFLVYYQMGHAPRALLHYARLHELAPRNGLKPESLRPLEPLAQRLREMLAPVAVDVPLPRQLHPDELESAFRERLSASEPISFVNPLAGGRQMKERAERIVEGKRGDFEKAHALHDALAARVDGVKLRRKTAVEALEAWGSFDEQFTCGDHAKLYTSLAREAGLQAFYTIVEKDPYGQGVEHACSAVVADGKVYLADPIYRWFGAPHQTFQVLDDIQAVAVHLLHNNGNPSNTITIARARTATRLWPESPLPWFMLSFACIGNQDWSGVREAAAKGIERSPEHRLAYLARASMASHDGDLEKAEALLRIAVTAGGSLPAVHYELGSVLGLQGKLEAAIAEFRAGLRGDSGPRAEWTTRMIAQVQERLTQGEHFGEEVDLRHPLLDLEKLPLQK